MRTPLIQPYLFFNGCCGEALDFYQSALGAEIDMVMRYDQAPEPPPPGIVPEGWGDKIMHASFRVGDQVVMASDGCEEAGGGFSGFSLSISVAGKDDVDRFFNVLAEGGQVTMPPGETFWSPRFGMLTDRFGISWMVGVLPETAER